MAKGFDEIAGEIVEKLILARGTAIASSSGNTTHVNTLFEKYLSDEAIAKSYKDIYKAILEATRNA